MTFASFDAAWWPYVYITLAGIIPTQMWRWIGVLASARLDETAEAFALVRAIATALVAGVITQLVLFPQGVLAEAPLLLRLGAVAIGFAGMELAGRRGWVGIVTGEAVLLGGLFLLDGGA